jgi:putative membrane protein insertion efficiency factor
MNSTSAASLRSHKQRKSLTQLTMRIAANVYRHVLSPILHTTHHALTGSTGACRFQPTCSEYAALAVQLHGPGRGARLALLRILRCHPFAAGGLDPVPPATPSKHTAAARHLP